MYQRINHGAVGGKIGNHVGLADDDLPVEDVVVGVVAAVHHKGEVHHKSRRVALTVGAGIGLVGRYAVVSQKLVVAHAVDDDASAGAFHIGGDVDPSAYEVQVLILHGVRVNRNRVGQERPVGVLRVFLASMQQGQECY